MNVKKYRIISIEAEKLVHSQLVGGFSARVNGKINARLFSGIFDYSLESEKLYHECMNDRAMSKKTYFFQNGHDYTTAVVNVKFNYTRHNFVSINNVFVSEGYRVSDAFYNCSEVQTTKGGEEILVAIKIHQPLEASPLPKSLLGEYFDYDAENNQYVRCKDQEGKTIPFASVEEKQSMREKLYRDGFDIDGVHYVRYKRSAGSSRTGQCLFIAEPLYKKMMKWSLCGLDIANRDDIDLASFEAYVSLSLSSITDTVSIPKESILFIKDAKSVFQTRAVSVCLNDVGSLTSAEQDVQVENVIWDGEALLDASVFAEKGYANKGMMLLRNRFFKTCAFNTNIQQYFADNNITSVSELCGYTRAQNISDIKMIVTESSLKYLKLSEKKRFEKKIDEWLSYIDDLFGIVKTDKSTNFFGGQVVRTSYQLLNTLGLSQNEVAKLLEETLDYYQKVRSSPMYMRNYINYILPENEEEESEENEGIAHFNARQQAILNCISQNDKFAETVLYKEFRSTVLSSFSRKIRSGKLLVKGTNATLFGNGLELLAAAIGKYHSGDRALALSGEGKIYCKHFGNGIKLLGCRSPHVTMGNLMCAENVHVAEVDRYFNLTDEIVYVNAIGCNIQQRLNGCDYDSDAMLLTDNALMVAAAQRNSSFAVPVCSISSMRKAYPDTPEGKALLDHEISQNKIGEIINLSQLLNTLYWHSAANEANQDEGNDKLYRDICILAVLSGMEIDKAKRNYDVATASALKILRAKYKMKEMPEFFKFIMYTLESKKFNGTTLLYDTTMDYIVSQTRHFIASASKARKRPLSLLHFIEQAQTDAVIKSGKNDARDCEAIKEYVQNSCSKIKELRVGLKNLDLDEKYQRQEEIEEIYSETIKYVSKKLKNLYMLKYLLLEIENSFQNTEEAAEEEEDKKFYWTLFEMLCLEENRFFARILATSRNEDMYDLVLDPSGDITIYDVRHTQKMSKFAKK